MNQLNEASVIAKMGFRAVGLRWEGTFAEAGAGGIRAVQSELRRRLSEISGIVNPAELLGLSYHANPGATGFVHYCAVEVSGEDEIPAGMTVVEVPARSYAQCRHLKGESIDRSYSNIYAWIEAQGFAAHRGDLTHFEVYPMAQDPYGPDPEFTIRIPVNVNR
jgi:predicted transcriptional regulator YdeE